MGMGVLSWIVLGLVAGWLASQFMRGGYGLIGDIVLGIVGAFLGAVALIAISRLVSGRRGALAR
jgi:uncharacterized membrane protein YeaQ/YmgE (transglycosylase-associated protein family)